VSEASCTSACLQSKTHGLAIVSLVCGLASIIFLMGYLAGIPAALFGHMALTGIRESGGTLTGVWMARAGLVLGYGASVGSLLIWAAWLMAGM
jgi:hypothetical protein